MGKGKGGGSKRDTERVKGREKEKGERRKWFEGEGS